MSRRGGRTSASGYVPSSQALPWPRCGSCVPLRGSTAAPAPAGPPPPPPDEGADARTGPPKGIVPSCCCCPPPPLNRQTLLTPPPQHPGMPLVVAAAAVPHPLVPLALLECWGPVLWRVPGQREQLHLVLGAWGEVCHRVRESQHYSRSVAAFGGAQTAPTSHLLGARGGGMHPGHDGGQLGDGALAAASTTSRGDVDRGAGLEASNFGFSSLPLLRGPPGDGGPSPMGLPAVANTAGRLAPAGAGRGSVVVRHWPSHQRCWCACVRRPVAGNIGPTKEGEAGGAAHVPPVWHASGGAFGTHGSGSRGTSRRGRGPLGLCDRAQTPSRCAPGLPLGIAGRRPTSPGTTNGAAGFARRPAAGVAMRGVLRDGAPAVG